MTTQYRDYVDAQGRGLGAVVAHRPPPTKATHIRVTTYEVIHRDGTESLLDEHYVPVETNPQSAGESGKE